MRAAVYSRARFSDLVATASTHLLARPNSQSFLYPKHGFDRACMLNLAFAASLHIVLTLLLVKLAFFLCRCILILLVLRNQVVHVALRLGELHLIHSLTCVPM